MVNWKTAESNEKLLVSIVAAIFATNNPSLDYAAIARYFGEDATYSAVENRLRSVRKTAQQLRASVDGENGEASSGTAGPKKRGRKPAGAGGQGGTPSKVGTNGVEFEDTDEVNKTGKRKRGSSTMNDIVIGARVAKANSKSKSKSITPKATLVKMFAIDESTDDDLQITKEITVKAEPTIDKKSKTKTKIPDEFLGSEEDRMLMEKDSNDEAFSLSEFDEAVEELGGLDGMMDF